MILDTHESRRHFIISLFCNTLIKNWVSAPNPDRQFNFKKKYFFLIYKKQDIRHFQYLEAEIVKTTFGSPK